MVTNEYKRISRLRRLGYALLRVFGIWKLLGLAEKLYMSLPSTKRIVREFDSLLKLYLDLRELRVRVRVDGMDVVDTTAEEAMMLAQGHGGVAGDLYPAYVKNGMRVAAWFITRDATREPGDATPYLGAPMDPGGVPVDDDAT